MDYGDLGKKILDNVGGEANVNNLIHCATRLRFTLKDESKADQAAIEQMDGVITVVKSGGQFQVVIGNNVPYVYDAIMAKTNLENADAPAKKEEVSGKLFDRFVDMLSSIFSPILGLLAGSGVLKGLLALGAYLGMDVKSGTYIILYAAADAMFYFLPIILAASAARKFKANQYIAMALAGALIYPTIVEAFKAGTKLTFTNIPVVLASYTGSVIPAILAVWILSKLQHFLEARLHESIRNLVTPFLSLIIMVPLTLMAVGPVATYASQMLANGYLWLYQLSPLVSGAIMGGAWQVLVIFGLHWGFVPVMLNNIASFQRDTLGAMVGPAVAAQTGAALGVFFRSKDTKMKGLSLSAFISGLFGITEPAIYGVTLKLKKPFIIGVISGAAGGALAGAMGAGALAVATRSVLTIPVYMGQGFLGYVGGYFGAMVLACILTVIVGFDEAPAPAAEAASTEQAEPLIQKEVLGAPVAGTLKPLSAVADETFASGALGKGFAIEPTDDTIVAPADGKITMLFPTHHAVGLLTDKGAEVLIHVGVDTVQLDGKGFEALVDVDQHVKAGTPLLKFDRKAIAEAGYVTDVITVVTNSTSYLDVINEQEEGQATSGENVTALMI